MADKVRYIKKDDHVAEAIKFQQPVVKKYPNSPVAKDYLRLSQAIIERLSQMAPKKGKKTRLDF